VRSEWLRVAQVPSLLLLGRSTHDSRSLYSCSFLNTSSLSMKASGASLEFRIGGCHVSCGSQAGGFAIYICLRPCTATPLCLHAMFVLSTCCQLHPSTSLFCILFVSVLAVFLTCLGFPCQDCQQQVSCVSVGVNPFEGNQLQMSPLCLPKQAAPKHICRQPTSFVVPLVACQGCWHCLSCPTWLCLKTVVLKAVLLHRSQCSAHNSSAEAEHSYK
jgi:hypothetical protein